MRSSGRHREHRADHAGCKRRGDEFPRARPITSRYNDSDNSNWTYYGDGSAGAKADWLRAKSQIITANGFTEEERTVLRMGAFRDHRERNGVDEREIKTPGDLRALMNLVLHSPFNKKELEILAQILDSLPVLFPIVIRSSAHGDAAGTGYYESVFFMRSGDRKKDLFNFEVAVKTVLASEFAPKAYSFRQKRGFEPGVAVIIENAFARDVSKEPDTEKRPRDLEKGTLFAPDLSGFAFTSSDVGPGFVSIVFGLPTTAVKGQGRIIVLEKQYPDDIASIAVYDKPSFLDLIDGAVVFDTRTGGLNGVGFSTNTCTRYGLNELFDAFKRLERDAGERLYLEFALRQTHNGIERAIHQISGVMPSDNSAMFPANSKSVFATSDFVLRAGAEDCKGVFFMEDTVSKQRLAEFNKTHKGYLLVADYKFFSDVRGAHEQHLARVNIHRDFHLDYSFFDNASAVLVCGPPEAKNSAKGHFEGALKEAQVVGGYKTGLVTYVREDLAALMGLGEDGLEGKAFVDANVRAVANSIENRMVLVLGRAVRSVFSASAF